jgi:CheY-like chemotaxis protein
MSPSEASLRVLVVDDSIDSAEMLAELISALGHHVRVAHLAASALDQLDAAPVDLIFLDLSLPDQDGLSVARAVRTRFGDSVRIIALTGFSGVEERAQSIAAGCEQFIVKPLKLDQLRKLLGS